MTSILKAVNGPTLTQQSKMQTKQSAGMSRHTSDISVLILCMAFNWSMLICLQYAHDCCTYQPKSSVYMKRSLFLDVLCTRLCSCVLDKLRHGTAFLAGLFRKIENPHATRQEKNHNIQLKVWQTDLFSVSGCVIHAQHLIKKELQVQNRWCVYAQSIGFFDNCKIHAMALNKAKGHLGTIKAYHDEVT